MTGRVLWTELRRGPALLVALITAAVGTAIVQGETYGARWMSVATAVQYSLFLVAPLVMAVAVWHGGHDRRRRMGEIVEATSRRRSSSVVVRWAALTIGTTAGMVVVAVGAAFEVAPRATYWGGGWWWLLGEVIVGLAAVNAVGMVVGWFLPYRALAPLFAIGTYALLLFILDGVPSRVAVVWDEASIMVQRVASLVPLGRPGSLDGFAVPARNGLSMLGWLLALIIAALVTMSARRSVVRAAIWLVPLVAAWDLRYHAALVEPDQAALEPVCAGAPTVCLARMNEYDRENATAVAADVFARWDHVPGGPTWAVDAHMGAAEGLALDQATAPPVMLDAYTGTWSGAFHHWPPCPEHSMEAERAAYVVSIWADEMQMSLGPEIDDLVAEFRSWQQADQRDWLSRYLRAGATCDQSGIAVLVGELRS